MIYKGVSILAEHLKTSSLWRWGYWCGLWFFLFKHFIQINAISLRICCTYILFHNISHKYFLWNFLGVFKENGKSSVFRLYKGRSNYAWKLTLGKLQAITFSIKCSKIIYLDIVFTCRLCRQPDSCFYSNRQLGWNLPRAVINRDHCRLVNHLYIWDLIAVALKHT